MRKSMVVLAILAALGAAPAFAASLQAEIVDSRPSMVVFAIGNDLQSTVVGDNQIDSITTAVAWVPGGSATPMPGASGMSQAGDVASNGDVCGWMESAQTGKSTAVIWYAASGYTTFTELGFPSTRIVATQAFRMNNMGELAVFSYMPGYQQQGQEPFGVANDYWRWTPTKGYAMLPHLSGQRLSYTWDINSGGTIVGYSTDLAGNQYATTWARSNNKLTVLGMPLGATSAEATSINDAGTICGNQNGGRDAWVWTKKAGFRKLPDYGFNASALQINNNGIIVGNADVEPYDTVPVVWDAAGNIYNLRDILGYDAYYFFEASPAINDKNQVVLYGYNNLTGDRDAVVVQLHFVN